MNRTTTKKTKITTMKHFGNPWLLSSLELSKRKSFESFTCRSPQWCKVFSFLKRSSLLITLSSNTTYKIIAFLAFILPYVLNEIAYSYMIIMYIFPSFWRSWLIPIINKECDVELFYSKQSKELMMSSC